MRRGPKRPVARKGFLFGEINVTPLVDVVLVLLIVFMVVAPHLARGKEVSLPTASNTGPTRGDVVQVTLRADGTLWLGGDEVTDDDLVPQVRSAIAAAESPEVVLRADSELRYREVMRIFATLREAGVQDVGLSATEPGEGG